MSNSRHPREQRNRTPAKHSATSDLNGGELWAGGATRVDLSDPTLFGNEVAEDERDEVFYSYAVGRPEIKAFSDPKNPLCIAHAYKGEGKSALLRLAQREVKRSKRAALVIGVKAPAIAPEVDRDDYAVRVRAWKASLVRLIASEIGAKVKMAWDDDAMTLVEESERSGAKKRSLLTGVLDRFRNPSIKGAGVELSLPERKNASVTRPDGAVARWLSGKYELWLIVDDVDKNFEATRTQKMQVAAFFDACRELVNAMPEVRIRTAIRPNIYTILRLEYESMSHISQYTYDLVWSESDVRQLLARRVEGYLRRRQVWDAIGRSLPRDFVNREEALIALAFGSPMPWGGHGRTRPAHVVLYTLSKHRPRWVIEIAKAAGASAVKNGRNRILLDDITTEFAAFGNRRIQDTAAEFRPRCAEVDELISAFTREREELTTAELLGIIERKVLSHMDFRIAGVTGKPNALQVAAFLFEIGFFYGRRENSDGGYDHYTFSDRPTLLKSRASVDDGMVWEIHPVFRQALEMRDASGRTIRYSKGRPVR